MADVPPVSPSVCILAHSHPDFSKGGGEMAAYRQFQTMRAAGRRVAFVGACEVGTAYAAQRPIEPVMRQAEDEHVYFFAGMAEDRLAWDDATQRRVLVEFLAGLGCDVYHLHHYWRVGVDLIHDLMEARPDATFVITLHEMLAICVHHGQMVKTRSRELCRRETPLNCLACYPDQTLDRFAFRKATLRPLPGLGARCGLERAGELPRRRASRAATRPGRRGAPGAALRLLRPAHAL